MGRIASVWWVHRSGALRDGTVGDSRAATLGDGTGGAESTAVVREFRSTSPAAGGDRRRNDCEPGGAGDRGGADRRHPRSVADTASGGQHGAGRRRSALSTVTAT